MAVGQLTTSHISRVNTLVSNEIHSYNNYKTCLLSAANPAHIVHILHCTEYPRSTFAVMDSGNCLVADISFDIIMSHLKGFYVLRKGQKFEVPYF